MRERHPIRRFTTIPAGLALLGAIGLHSPAPAESRPRIGLGAPYAQGFLEATLAGHAPGAADRFGSTVAVGDFNADGADDLAIGIPGEDCAADVTDCGAVSILFGTVGCGFYCQIPLFLDPWADGAPDAALANERYGAALAVGDFDCDGFDDLAVGVPGNVTPPYGVTGSVQIHRGLPGLSGSIEWVASRQLAPGVGGFPAPVMGRGYGSLGAALASGDFNADGCDDLAIGDPLFDHAGAANSGIVFAAHGHPDLGEGAGLVPYAGFYIEEAYFSVPGEIEAHDHFGQSLATGDFNCDTVADLAIGVPGQDSLFFGANIGVATVIYGAMVHSLILTADGGVPAPRSFSDYGLEGNSEPDDEFGSVLASGDFDDDGCDELAFGTPIEDVSGVRGGFVVVAHGEPSGLSSQSPERFGEDAIFGPGAARNLDAFGKALTVADFDRDGFEDLAIGIPGDDDLTASPTLFESGGVAVVLGGSGSRMFEVARRLYPYRPPATVGHAGMLPDEALNSPAFGAALAAGDFDGNDQSDLAIGAIGRDFAGMVAAGAVAVLYGHLFMDGFEAGDALEWSGAVP